MIYKILYFLIYFFFWIPVALVITIHRIFKKLISDVKFELR